MTEMIMIVIIMIIPAMEDEKATRKIVRLRIRHSMLAACLQTLDVSILERRRNKSHSHSKSRGLRASKNIRRPCFIERPNSNLLISSGFFFFHRGLPFPSVLTHRTCAGVYVGVHQLVLWNTACVSNSAAPRSLRLGALENLKVSCASGVLLASPTLPLGSQASS